MSCKSKLVMRRPLVNLKGEDDIEWETIFCDRSSKPHDNHEGHLWVQWKDVRMVEEKE